MEVWANSSLVSFPVTALAAASIMSSVTRVAPLATHPRPTPATGRRVREGGLIPDAGLNSTAPETSPGGNVANKPCSVYRDGSRPESGRV